MGEEMRDIVSTDKKEKSLDEIIRFHPDTAQYIEEEASRTGKTRKQILDELLAGDFAIISFEETAGKATLEFKSWTWDEPVKEKAKDKPKIFQQYRDLREKFAPVTAGINFHKKFATGGGMRVMIENPRDDHQIEVQDEINTLNRMIYQDYYTRGLDRILNIMVDEALTVGASAAEIVYENEFQFTDFVTREEEIPNPDAPDEAPKKYIITRMPTSREWKKFGGITKLKIINKAVERLTPRRHPVTWEILYWTLDEEVEKVEPLIPETKKKQKKEPKKFLPWQIFWLSWNTRGVDLIGNSIIKPVVTIAKLVQEIQTALAKGFRRWANKKYFFVCGTDKRPWGRINQRNFMAMLKLLIEQNWSGMPVPQGFDIKEIGGEIFDSRNLLDYLTGQICTGMTYPRDFLEQGRTRASDKAWLAWQVTYGEAQLQIRRAIEHQLWETHLWCKYGKQRRIKKQGVPKKKQKKEPTYVPKVEWRSESKWHMTERLNMDIQILNVANPVGPQLKLAVEKDIAKTMGWGDVILPSFQELEKELKKIEEKMLEEEKKGKQKRPPPSPEERLRGMQKPPAPRKPPPPAGGTRKPSVLTGTPLKSVAEVVQVLSDELINQYPTLSGKQEEIKKVLHQRLRQRLSK